MITAQGLAPAREKFHALSDPTRLAIVELLLDGEMCVCDLMTALEAAQSRLSFHLRVLREAGLVTDRKEGRWSYYRLAAEPLEELAAVVGAVAEQAAVAPASSCVCGAGTTSCEC